MAETTHITVGKQVSAAWRSLTTVLNNQIFGDIFELDNHEFWKLSDVMRNTLNMLVSTLIHVRMKTPYRFFPFSRLLQSIDAKKPIGCNVLYNWWFELTRTPARCRFDSAHGRNGRSQSDLARRFTAGAGFAAQNVQKYCSQKLISAVS